LINKLVVENLRHRPIRTLLSTVAIGVQVTMILTLVGVSEGMLADIQERSRGVGADILMKAPGSSVIGFSTNFSDKYIPLVRKQPHVTAVTGTLVQPAGGIDSVTGIDLKEFETVSGPIEFIEGSTFRNPDDMIIDTVWQKTHNLHPGSTFKVLNRSWNIVGVVQPGKLAHMFVQRSVLQDLFANNGKLTAAYIKVDNPANTQLVIDELKSKLNDFPIYSMEQFLSYLSVDNVPMLKPFIWVIVTLGVLIGFLVVFLSMYTAVLERTREIGVLKALGASPGYILNILLRETVLLALCGSVAGILMTYGTKWLIESLVPSMSQAIIPIWWPISTSIAIVGAVLGATYPGLKAAKQDAIEALAYD
jgi:putative ABC transport system permease protein